MDTQVIFNIAISVAGALALWVLNQMTQRIQKLEDMTAGMKETIPKEYVQKSDYRNDIDEVKSILRQIFDKLDAKADK